MLAHFSCEAHGGCTSNDYVHAWTMMLPSVVILQLQWLHKDSKWTSLFCQWKHRNDGYCASWDLLHCSYMIIRSSPSWYIYIFNYFRVHFFLNSAVITYDCTVIINHCIKHYSSTTKMPGYHSVCVGWQGSNSDFNLSRHNFLLFVLLRLFSVVLCLGDIAFEVLLYLLAFVFI